MANATSFWGAADGNDGLGVDCYTAVTTVTATCNGNGDGNINLYGEVYRMWQHLSNTGLAEGAFRGFVSPLNATTPPTLGQDVPRSKMGNAYWTAARLSQLFTSSSEVGYTDLPDVWSNYLFFTGINTGYWISGNILKPEEAWNIDTKMDDGRPAFGKMRANINCATGNTSTATYNIGVSTVSCPIVGFML
ncbi:MAG: hypothetical protein ACOYNL_08770 [Rickettsiales bacterium]